MSKSPAFQFYAQDFLTGTAYMTSEEVGGYIRLLCHEWVSGFVPNDDKKILQLALFHRRCLVAVREKFFKGKDGNLYNEKLEEIRQKQIDYSNKQKANVMNRYRKEATTVVPPNLPNEHQKPTLHSSSSNNSLPKGKESKRLKSFIKPTLEEVQEFYSTNGGTKDQGEYYFNNKEAIGWTYGKGTPLKDWKADSRNWIKNGYGLKFQPQQNTQPAQSKIDFKNLHKQY